MAQRSSHSDDMPNSLFLARVRNAKRSAAVLLKTCVLSGDVIRQAADIYSELDRIEWMINKDAAPG